MRIFRPLIGAVLLVFVLGLVYPYSSQAYQDSSAPQAIQGAQVAPSSDGRIHIYLPMVRVTPKPSPLGFETNSGNLAHPVIAQRAAELGAAWVRLNTISWRAVQPNENGGYNWSALATFDAELAKARELGLTSVVVVDEYPSWATTLPNKPCSAIKQEHFGRYADFMAALVTRYPDIQYWELGNEPDVAPELVPNDAIWGCWGNANDVNYGGGHYGNMVKVVTPRMRAASSSVKIMIGGLLLNNPNVADRQPARFLEGILSVGAAPYFDIVPYHGHSSYYGPLVDHSGNGGGWAPLGPAKGKPAFLRQVMQKYGVSKPLFFNEASLGCNEATPGCASPGTDFFEAQATHAVRMSVRTLSVGVENVSWYTLEGPGWRHGGLLDHGQAPRPAYHAYRTLVRNVQDASMPPLSISDYAGVEAYRLRKPGYVVDVVWSVDGSARPVSVPQAKFIGAFDRNGNPVASGTLTVGFSPMYIHRHP